MRARALGQAQGGPANSSSRGAEQVAPLGPEDALVMVLFPQAAWEAVLALARDLDVTPPEALGAALALLRRRVDEEGGRGGDQ